MSVKKHQARKIGRTKVVASHYSYVLEKRKFKRFIKKFLKEDENKVNDTNRIFWTCQIQITDEYKNTHDYYIKLEDPKMTVYKDRWRCQIPSLYHQRILDSFEKIFLAKNDNGIVLLEAKVIRNDPSNNLHNMELNTTEEYMMELKIQYTYSYDENNVAVKYICMIADVATFKSDLNQAIEQARRGEPNFELIDINDVQWSTYNEKPQNVQRKYWKKLKFWTKQSNQ